jgi:hypothetical protein
MGVDNRNSVTFHVMSCSSGPDTTVKVAAQVTLFTLVLAIRV